MARFMFPAHPPSNIEITPAMLSLHERQDAWIAQRKFNGSHCVVWGYQDQVVMWNRDGDPFGNYHLTESMKECILSGLNRDYDVEYVLDGELLHTKAKIKTTQKQAVTNTIVLYDILYAGRYLTKLTTLERLDLLYKMAPPVQLEPKKRAFLVKQCKESQLWVAETFYNEFSDHFWEMYEFNSKNEDQYPEIEGLMLKLKSAKNTSIGTCPNDVNWMVRCKKAEIR